MSSLSLVCGCPEKFGAGGKQPSANLSLLPVASHDCVIHDLWCSPVGELGLGTKPFPAGLLGNPLLQHLRSALLGVGAVGLPQVSEKPTGK